jgi:hypothetical protein
MVSEQENFDQRSQEGRGSTPKPDPTVLTTEALLREISALRTLIDQRISATESLFETKILLGREGGAGLKELLTSKIDDLEKMLGERYATQTKALDAAFVAQQTAVATQFEASEKAIEKANAATEKRFDSMSELLSQQSLSLDRRITEIKTIVDKGFTGVETRQVGIGEKREDSRANVAIMISVGVGVLSIIAMFVTTMIIVAHH